jgi:Holliday junction DNA helicase RuvA
MIDLLKGEIAALKGDSVIVLVGGVGFRVFVPVSTLGQLGEVGNPVTLHTYLAVREDALMLYGFSTEDEKACFLLLITVSGIGPKLGITILSRLTPEQVRSAISREDLSTLQRVPGIGKKIAEKIVFELRNKVGLVGGDGGIVISEVDKDVLAALTAMGYSLAEAQTAVAAIPRETPQDLNMRIVIALQYFG